MIPVHRPCGQASMPLPEKGIHTPDGHLFHHTNAYGMMPVHYERLRQYGIDVVRKKFTPAEDKIVRENCMELCKEYEWDLNQLLRISGYGKGRGGQKQFEKTFRKTTNFWPRVCRGLEHRCAQTISQRLVWLFDPLNDNSDVLFTAEEDQLLIYWHRTKSIPIKEMCDRLQRPFSKVWTRITSLQYRKMFSKSERRKLFFIVCGQFPAEKSPESDWNFPGEGDVDWTVIGKIFYRNKEVLQREYAEMVRELKTIREQNDAISLDDALLLVAPDCLWISAADFAEYIMLWLSECPELDSLYLNTWQKKEMMKKMREYGITGFRTGRISEYQYCRLRMGRLLSALRRRFLRPARLRLSLSTQLRLLSRCLRSLPDPQANRPIALTRNHVIRQLEREMESDNPGWKMSGKLKRYIRDTCVGKE